MTPKKREELKNMMAAIDENIAPLEELMRPLQDAVDRMEALRDIILEQHGLTEAPAVCEGCEALIIPGDKHHPTADAGPLCAECAPTWADVRSQADETAKEPALDAEDREGARATIAAADAHIAAGGSPEDKVLYEYEV